MNKSRRVKLAVVVLAVLLAVSSSIKEVKAGQSSTKEVTTDGDMKLHVILSLDDSEAYSSDPRVVRIRITNASSVPVPLSALTGIEFSLFKYHRDNKYLAAIGELFLSKFSAKDFEAVSPARELPKELKCNEQLEFKVNLSNGVWADVTSSLIDDETKGFHWVGVGHYFIAAKVILNWPGAAPKNRKTFESNEIEIKRQ